jgi:hypothetical protein
MKSMKEEIIKGFAETYGNVVEVFTNRHHFWFEKKRK